MDDLCLEDEDLLLVDLEDLDFSDLEDEADVFLEDLDLDEDLSGLAFSPSLLSIGGISFGGVVFFLALGAASSLEEAELLPWLSSANAGTEIHSRVPLRSISANNNKCMQWCFTDRTRGKDKKNRRSVYRAAI